MSSLSLLDRVQSNKAVQPLTPCALVRVGRSGGRTQLSPLLVAEHQHGQSTSCAPETLIAYLLARTTKIPRRLGGVISNAKRLQSR